MDLFYKERKCSQGEQTLFFKSRNIPLQKEGKTILKELPPVKTYQFPLIGELLMYYNISTYRNCHLVGRHQPKVGHRKTGMRSRKCP